MPFQAKDDFNGIVRTQRESVSAVTMRKCDRTEFERVNQHAGFMNVKLELT
jgi:hypothetical protein